MRQSSVIIHKGEREEKYEIYIEDYVMSLLRKETGTLELAEFYFYGIKENGDRRYVIYGAGKDKKLNVFDKYSLLDEIGCRLTQAGPVFWVKEETGIYEIKGYKIFYQNNTEMQNYLIEHNAGNNTIHRTPGPAHSSDTAEDSARKIPESRASRSAISVQLGIILVALIAIVINSTNSYDKMNRLNQSAVEVLFAIENQEADVNTDAGDSEQEEDALKLAVLENEEWAQELPNDETAQTEADEEVTVEIAAEDTAAEDAAKTDDTETREMAADEAERQDETPVEDSDKEEELEALSRNVARYYEVEKGDTLYTICKKIYGDITYVEKICELNQITNPDNIRYGQKIVLP